MVDFVFGVIGTLLYPLFSIVFVVIRAIQNIFYAFAGIGNITYDNTVPISSGNTGAENDTGLIYYLLTRPLVKNMMLSIMLLAIFLIVIFTVMAFIKNVYSPKPKGWKDIVGSAIKGLMHFVLLPAFCLIGIWLSNILLQAINGATSSGGSTSMDRKLFIACAYNANMYRSENAGTPEKAYERISESLKLYGLDDEIPLEEGQSLEYYANKVDQMYSYDRIGIHNHITVGVGVTAHHGYYNLYQINYIVLIVGGIFMLYILGSLTFGMIKRMFYLIVLFIISPGVCALYPLDDGSAVKKWKDEVFKQTISAYGSVAGVNIFFSIIPLIDKIDLAGFFGTVAGINNLVSLFIFISGLLVVKDLVTLVTNFVGGDNALSAGSSLMNSTKSAAMKYGKTASKFAGVAAKPLGAMAKGAWNITKGAASSLGNVANRISSAHAARVERRRRETLKAKYGKENMPIEERRARIAELARRNAERHSNNPSAADVAFWSDDATNLERIKKLQAAGGKLSKEEKKFVNDHNKDQNKLHRYAKKHGWGEEKDGQFQYADMVGDPINDDFIRQQMEHDAWAKQQKIAARKAKIKSGAQKFGGAISKGAKAFGNSAFGQAVANEAKKIPGGAVVLAQTLFDATGLKKNVDEVTGGYKEGSKLYGKYQKEYEKGRLGEKEIIKELAKLKKQGFHLSTEAINKMTNGFGEQFAKFLLASKDANGKKVDSEFAKTMGLNKDSSESDIAAIDKILGRLESFKDRINSAAGDKETQDEILKEAVKYAAGTDSDGNEQLKNALQEALKSFKHVSVDGKVDLNGDTINAMMRASAEAYKSSNKTFIEQLKNLMKEVDKENAKKK